MLWRTRKAGNCPEAIKSIEELSILWRKNTAKYMILIIPKEKVFFFNLNNIQWYIGNTIFWAYQKKRSNFAYTNNLPHIRVFQKSK